MKNKIFINTLWFKKILYLFFFKFWPLKFYKFHFKYWWSISNFFNIFLFKLLYHLFIFRNLICIHFQKIGILKNSYKLLDLKNKTIYKGFKSKNLGVYIRSFLENKKNFKESTKFCYLIMRFTRKNLFLTLLNNDGNVLCKTNIGSCGFKKKVKFTGYAIKRTSKRFSKKILGSFIKNIYFVRENCKKKMYKIKELIFLNNKNINIFNKRINIFNSKKILINKKRKKINNKKRNKYKFIKIKKKHKKKIYNKKVLRAIIKKKKILKNFNKYRNYPYLVESIRKAFNIKIRVKSNFKFWGFKFVMYGLARRFRWFNGIEIRLPVPHSEGLRLKKKRRV